MKALQMKMTTHVEMSAKMCEDTDEVFDFVVKAAVEREKAGLKKLRQARHEYLIERRLEKAGDTLRGLFTFGKK